MERLPTQRESCRAMLPSLNVGQGSSALDRALSFERGKKALRTLTWPRWHLPETECCPDPLLNPPCAPCLPIHIRALIVISSPTLSLLSLTRCVRTLSARTTSRGSRHRGSWEFFSSRLFPARPFQLQLNDDDTVSPAGIPFRRTVCRQDTASSRHTFFPCSR